MPTYSAAVWSSTDDIVIEFEIWVENFRVELNSPVELVADFHPVGSSFIGHRIASIAWYQASRTYAGGEEQVNDAYGSFVRGRWPKLRCGLTQPQTRINIHQLLTYGLLCREAMN